MLHFTATIVKFGDKGEKTGWTYIAITSDLAYCLKPATKKTFRVKGYLDDYYFEGLSLVPMGNGNFIMPLNAIIRKGIKKGKGASIAVRLQVDTNPVMPPPEFIECLEDEPEAVTNFFKLAKSHQNYFIKWITAAKGEATKAKRIAQAVTALANGKRFDEMIRMNKKQESDNRE